MSDARDLLIELGTEELPPKALAGLAQAFRDGLAAALGEALDGNNALQAEAFASPRRLAVRIAAVPVKQPDRAFERLGPAVSTAFDADGQPTGAATGFARSCGVAVEQLERRATDKGERLAYTGTESGKPLAALLPRIAADALKGLPIPKRMRWGDSEDTFVRPVHWLLVLHGPDVVPMTLFGCTADRLTYGHRFHYPQAIELAEPGAYERCLRDPGHVLVSPNERRGSIRSQVERAASDGGGSALIHDALLDEVTALVEWPVALAGGFEERYLELPREVLIATLEHHQRYFPVAGDDGGLLPRFVTVANIASRDPARVIAGNERVVRPRLADALFFWRQDHARGLEAYAAELGSVTFQRGLGSLADKSRRIADLAAWIAGELALDGTPIERAAYLAKADLLSEMVGEFPELQGTMGRYYAEDEAPAVALALEEQYAPRHAGAAIPVSAPGRVLALADRLDTLAGVFVLGKRPTGDKDPFALRRAALGVLRILIEAGLDLDLSQALLQAVAHQPADRGDAHWVADELLAFHSERLRAYYADRGVAPAVFESVSALGLSRPLDFDRRIRAVREFLSEGAADRLCSAHKRIRNILKGVSVAGQSIDSSLLAEPAERKLHDALIATQRELVPLSACGDYAGALRRLAQLQEPVDRFFDNVLVMSEDETVRDNRLALLAALDAVCREVADISRLSPE